MSVPVHTSAYATQNTAVGAPVILDITPDWLDALMWEVLSLPPGFAFDGDNISASPPVNMDYTIFVRAGNDDGFSDWAPLRWVTTGLDSTRTLIGLSLNFELINPIGIPAILSIQQATPAGRQTTWDAGEVLLSDVPEDGNADRYDSSVIGEQIDISGATDVYVRATREGWEVILDTSGE